MNTPQGYRSAMPLPMNHGKGRSMPRRRWHEQSTGIRQTTLAPLARSRRRKMPARDFGYLSTVKQATRPRNQIACKNNFRLQIALEIVAALLGLGLYYGMNLIVYCIAQKP